MRIIVIGGGEVGYALAKALAPDHDIFVIDPNPAVGDRFSALDVEFVTGSGTSAAVLRRAQIDACECLIACSGFDEVNILACSIATRLGTPDTICFVSREELLGPLGDPEALREQFGVHKVIWPEAELAADIERIIAAPGAIDAETFADNRIRLLEYRLSPESPFTGTPLATLNLPRGSLIVAAKHGDAIVIPRGDTRLMAGDKMIVMGTHDAMREIERRMQDAAGVRPRTQLVTIVGGGDVGLRLAQGLESAPAVELRVIERDPRRAEMLAGVLQRALVLTGDGTDLELLELEQIGLSDVMVSVIDNDERNLFASLLGRQLGVRKVITRVSAPRNLRLFERVGIDVALSARGAAIAAVLHRIGGGKADLLAVLEEGQAKVLELIVPADYPPTALRDLRVPREAIVATIVRQAGVIVPRGDDVIRPGDRLLIFCTAAAAEEVRDFFTVRRT